MPQEARLLLLELVQPRAKPLEPLAEVAHVLRAVHFNRMGKIRATHLPDRHVELTDRSRDQHREQDREHQRDRPRRQREITPGLTPLCRGYLQPFDLALGQAIAGRQHRLRARGQIRVALRQRCARARLPMRQLEQDKEPALGVAQFAELGQLRAFQRQLLQLLRRLLEILPQPRVIVDELRIVENEMLADESLQRRRLLVELPARAPRLR